MWKKNDINSKYRIVCLSVFLIVILMIKSIFTISILMMFFILVTRKDNNLLFVLFYLLGLLGFIMGYLVNDLDFFKVIIMVCYVYYFLNVPSFNSYVKHNVDTFFDKKLTSNKERKEETEAVNDNEYLRFKENNKDNKAERKKTSNMEVMYVTIHLLFLFISIMVG